MAKKQRKSPKSAPAVVLHLTADNGNADAIRDALRGRHVNRFQGMSRTRAIHEVLYEAYERGEVLKTSQITMLATQLMLAVDAHNGGNGMRHDGQPIACRATSSHLNTMSKPDFGREYVERVPGGWRLTPVGAHLCKLELTAEDRARLRAIQAAHKQAQRGKAESKPAKKQRKGKGKAETNDDSGE